MFTKIAANLIMMVAVKIIEYFAEKFKRESEISQALKKKIDENNLKIEDYKLAKNATLEEKRKKFKELP